MHKPAWQAQRGKGEGEGRKSPSFFPSCPFLPIPFSFRRLLPRIGCTYPRAEATFNDLFLRWWEVASANNRAIFYRDRVGTSFHMRFATRSGGTPLYKLYRYVPNHRVGFLRRFGLKTVIHLVHFGLESGMVFEGTTECMNVFIVSILNELESKRNIPNRFKSFLPEGKVWKRVWKITFLSEIGWGFGEPDGTPPPRVPRSTPAHLNGVVFSSIRCKYLRIPPTDGAFRTSKPSCPAVSGYEKSPSGKMQVSTPSDWKREYR